MILQDGNAGVLDFQDAVYGPIFLDPSALFKDLYLKIKDEELNALLEEYLSRSNELGLKLVRTIKNPRKSFDLTGLQRQLRILGTLSRLHLRDGKSFRLSDLPKTLNFVMDTSMKYQELNEVSNYLKERVAPLLTQKLKENL
jgi:aminoglycoside/choline kinase family phosphotransferase